MPIESITVSASASANLDNIFNPNTRSYTVVSPSFSRKPWSPLRSIIHSLWGDFREKCGLASEVRQIRNNLHKLANGDGGKQLEKFLAHLEKTGEAALHGAVTAKVEAAKAATRADAATVELDAVFEEFRERIKCECDRTFNNPWIVKFYLDYASHVMRRASLLDNSSRHLKRANEILKDHMGPSG